MNVLNEFPVGAHDMIAEAKRVNRPGRDTSLQRNLTPAAVAEKTEELLATEISFIPNEEFSRLNRNAAKQIRLAEESLEASSSEYESSASRTRLPSHLERLCAAPLLSRDEEQTLFRRLNFLKFRANYLRSKLDPSKANAAAVVEIERLLSLATQVRNQICRANTRLVISIVKKFSDERYTFDDLLSEGIGCLIRTIDKFDFDRGFRFSTYVTMAVRREIFRSLQRRRKRDTRFVTSAELVLDRQLDDEESLSRSEQKLTRINDTLTELMSHLEDREQFIVKARYGFDDLGAKPTFSKLGEYLNVSKERVRQLENRAIQKLRAMLEETKTPDNFEVA